MTYLLGCVSPKNSEKKYGLKKVGARDGQCTPLYTPNTVTQKTVFGALILKKSFFVGKRNKRKSGKEGTIPPLPLYAPTR